MQITCTRRLQFCAGHRLIDHEGPCKHVHGHNYVVFITAERDGTPVDPIGRVIDFSVLKERVNEWIAEYWDHKFICNIEDTVLITWMTQQAYPLYAMQTNPTAEHMAALLLNVCNKHLFRNAPIVVTKIVLWETENCYAEVTCEKG